MLDYTYLPVNDGKDHINIYSKGHTELGRLLSNFARTPIEHPDYGYFVSIEGFWYWLSTGKKHDKLRYLYGTTAKFAGKEFDKVNVDNFIEEIKKALKIKLEQHDNIRVSLISSTLPLAHYYYYGDPDNPKVHTVKQYKWITEYWEELRTLFQKNK